MSEITFESTGLRVNYYDQLSRFTFIVCQEFLCFTLPCDFNHLLFVCGDKMTRSKVDNIASANSPEGNELPLQSLFAIAL